ncbi:Uncharacterized protein BM_BM8228 [Brugia malayi]|uniref:BZIP domain-containing protein n=1 Tax=Brugia malayi TaxID=6279 RepID=A0A4E9FF49_BRUMA|nr:Uncharacterized protein BM_BM8228 [Brugia malayi]VIO94884.1 Uncharacterized protein BM_BM8228 [Brugia malayi]
MDQIDEEDWCQIINKNDFIKDDCLISSIPDCCNNLNRYDNDYHEAPHCLFQSNKNETTISQYANIISDNDTISLDVEALEEQLNMASNLLDVKIELNNSYPIASETLSLTNSHSSSSFEHQNNGIFRSSFTTGQSFLDEADCLVELKAYAKTRRKMHEMAVKQKLITEQDPKGYGFLHLSSEEKRTLLQEGYKLPTVLPLTKSEEDALKIIRRKIKNKLSAQESRRKRKEYMNALEKRIQYYLNENSTLKLKLKDLEQKNRSLFIELKHFKTSIGSNHRTENHPSCPTPNVTTIN